MMYVYGFWNGSATATVEEYRRRFPMDRILDCRVFYMVFNTLRKCSTLPSAHVSSERACKRNMDEQKNILVVVQRSPTIITRRLSALIGVSWTHVWQTMHEDDLFHFTHSLCKIYTQGSVIHLEFCHWLHTNRQLLPLRLFTDEATFTHNGINNTRNCHQWSPENPHGTVETNFQHHLSINMWCCILDDMLIGAVNLGDLMTGQNYVDFLQNELINQLEDVLLTSRIAMYFQHDWATSHHTRHVIQHLNDPSPNRWIGHGSTINSPPRYPNLTTLDFGLWGLTKGEVYRKRWIHKMNFLLT